MGSRRASDDLLQRTLRRVLADTGGVRSLARLHRLVEARLHEEDTRYGVTPERLRRLAATSPRVQVKIHTRTGPRRALGALCPVCHSPLARVENRTLTGDRVVLEARCNACGYWTGRSRRVPVRYVFHTEQQPRRHR